MEIIRSLLLFILAGFCEIGGGYLVWLWVREGRPIYYGLLGLLILGLYGVVATLQPSGFGRVYATYGGVFIAMSLLWAWRVDGFKPDRYDIIGAVVAIAGVMIIMYAPRGPQTQAPSKSPPEGETAIQAPKSPKGTLVQKDDSLLDIS